MGKLPTIIIAGFQKCGTTALQEIMLQCPESRGPRLDPDEPEHFSKEVHFFDLDDRFERGLEWYKAQFPESGTHALDSTPCRLRSPKTVGSARSMPSR